MMKSNQINFFILPDDLRTIEEIFLKHEAIFIKQPIYNLNEIYTNTIQYPRDVKLFDKIYLTAKEFMNNIILEKIDNQQYHLVNVLLSEVVEFSRGGFLFNCNKLERGRLYYDYSYLKNNLPIEKSSEFKRWANSIISAIKKDILIKNNPKSIYYLSKNSENWIIKNNAIVHKSGLYITIDKSNI